MRRTMGLALCLLLAGCRPMTSGEGCDLLGGTFCARCASFDRQECMSSVLSGCCKGAACERPVRDTGRVNECNAQLQQTSCASLLQGNLPSICRGVLAP